MRWLNLRGDRSAKVVVQPRRVRRWSRRSVYVALGGTTLVALIGAGWWLERSGRIAEARDASVQQVVTWLGSIGLSVANVEVEGRGRSSREAILAALGVSRGTPLLAVDPAAAKRRLESLPWVRAASVERRLPDTIYIRLVERQPLAFWQRQGKLVLVDRDGVVIPNERLEKFGNLIVLVGEDAPGTGAALVDMLAGEPDIAGHVAAAVRVGARRWNLHLDSGIEIALPEEDAAAAWHRLAEFEHRDGLLERDVQMVDLRLPDRLVVRPTGEIQKPVPKKSRQPGKTT
ncbi:MAG TPA: FtsQ-type POTRA domain-containing protein [Stellaceae bacterium]|nr:FtsQ-type POTRA domain-containing protein [Stellaceae bacterium]